MDRRRFLKTASMSALAALILSGCDEEDGVTATSVMPSTGVTSSPPSTAPATTNKADVIIIGAGIAGLAAARQLQKDGWAVLLLEARDRIGGRVWTDNSLGMPLDMGASWIHGVRGNPVTDLAEAFGVETAVTDYDNQIVYDYDGRKLSDDELEELESWLEELVEEMEADGEELDEDAAMGTIINAILAKVGPDPDELRHLNYVLNSIIEHEYAADVDELSVWYGQYGEEFDGKDVIFPGGYSQLIQPLAAELDIRLNQIVSQIAYGDGVIVTTNQGNFTSDYAIVTLPLGVLQQGTVTFSPPLPPEKQTAVSKLGMGLLNKTYFKFDAPFWDKEAVLIGHIGEQKGVWAEFLNLYKFTGEPVLLGFNAADYARSLEPLTDEQIIADGMRVLRTLYGVSIPEPQATFITRWAADPFAGGSYSFVPPGAGEADYEAMAEPVAERLFFAGEATHPEYPATVHGALLSGYREAKRIMRLKD